MLQGQGGLLRSLLALREALLQLVERLNLVEQELMLLILALSRGLRLRQLLGGQLQSLFSLLGFGQTLAQRLPWAFTLVLLMLMAQRRQLVHLLLIAADAFIQFGQLLLQLLGLLNGLTVAGAWFARGREQLVALSLELRQQLVRPVAATEPAVVWLT